MVSLLSAAEQIVLEYRGQIPRTGDSPYITSIALDYIWALFENLGTAKWAKDANLNEYVFQVDLLNHNVSRFLLLQESLCERCQLRKNDTAEIAQITLGHNVRSRCSPTRSCTVQEIPINVGYFVNPICGVLSKKANRKTKHSLTAPVVGAFFRSDDRHQLVTWSGHKTNFRDSLLVGIMEGLERQAGLSARAKRTSVFASYKELGSAALDPSLCGLGAPDAYPPGAKITQYTPDLQCKWVWGYSLVSNRPILVPWQMAYYGPGEPGDVRFMEHCSSGCAIGGCFEDAILNGLLELVERDAFMISWTGRLALPRIDPNTCPDLTVLHLQNKLDLLGWDLHLLDGRLDLKIPAVIAVALRRDGQLGSLLLGAGCSVDPNEAIRAAVSEVAAYVVGSDEITRRHQKRARELMARFDLVKDIEDHILLYGLPEMAEKVREFYLTGPLNSFDEIYKDASAGWSPDCPSDNLKLCILEVQSRLKSDVIVVDQTPAEQNTLGLKTVCVIIPGLLPIEFGYGRRRALAHPRLFTAPVYAGYVLLKQEGLNILPHPFP